MPPEQNPTLADVIAAAYEERLRQAERTGRRRLVNASLGARTLPWELLDDGYRIWRRPAEGNPLRDRAWLLLVEYKHLDGGQLLAALVMGDATDA